MFCQPMYDRGLVQGCELMHWSQACRLTASICEHVLSFLSPDFTLAQMDIPRMTSSSSGKGETTLWPELTS